MKILIFLTTIFLTTVNGYVDEWNLIHLKKEAIEINDCLNATSTLWNELKNYMDITRWRNYFLYELSDLFEMGTIHVEQLNRVLMNILNELVRRNQLRDNQTGPIKVALMSAIMDCIDDERPEIRNESGYHNLPSFYPENSNLSELLNLILVDLESLIEQTERLDILCSFALHGLRALELAFEHYRYALELRDDLRSMWYIRAENFFDFASDIPYIRHAYSMDSTRLYTRDDPNLFNIRVRTDFSVRNALTSQEDISRILNFHLREREYLRGFHSFQPHSLPHRFAMTESNMYYEIRVNRFFRVLFFFLELVDKGYADLNGNVLNDQPLPEDLLNMLQNDTVYGPYLEMARNRELNLAEVHGLPAVEKYIRSLRGIDFTLEPDVIMLFYLRLRFFNTTTTISKSTTISFVYSSTSRYEDSNEEKKVTQVPPENYDPKSQEKNNALDSESDYYYDWSPSCSKYYQNLRLPKKEIDGQDGCTEDSGDSEQLLFPEEGKMLFDVLQDTLLIMYT